MKPTIAAILMDENQYLHGPEGPDAPRVHPDQRRREQQDPDPRGHAREPEPHVVGDRRHLGADAHHDAHPVGPADQVAGERADVVLGVRAERAGRRVSNRHLRQAAHQQEGDESADRVAQDDARASDTDRELAAQEQARANGAADGNHAHLAGGQPPVQALFAGGDVREVRSAAHVTRPRRKYSGRSHALVSSTSRSVSTASHTSTWPT